MKKKLFASFAGTGLALLAIFATLSGCSSTAVAAGWAGGTVSGDSVYTVSSQGQLVAMTTSGTQQWASAVEGTAASGGFLSCSAGSTLVAVYGTPAVAGDYIYVAGYNGKIYSYSISKQAENSNATLDTDDSKPIVGGVTAGGGKVFVGSSNGNLYALDGKTLAVAWRFATGGKIWCTPAVDNGTVFAGSFDKKVYAVDEATGSLKWQFPASGTNGSFPREWFFATPVISNGVLYAPCMDGKVYAVNIKDGTSAGLFDVGDAVSSSPVVVAGKVIVATQEAKVYSLDAAAGTKTLLLDFRLSDKQGSATVNSQLSAQGNTVFIHTLLEDKMYAMDAATGAAKSLSLGAITGTPTSIVATTVVVTSVVPTTITVTK